MNYKHIMNINKQFNYQHIKVLDHYAIFIATLLQQLHSTPSLMLILSLMKSHHIGDSTISSMMHNMSSIGTNISIR